MTVIEHAQAHAPLKPSYPGSYGRYGGRHPRRPFRRRHYDRRYYDRRPYYRQQPIYVVQETPRTYNVPVSHWWGYPSSWYHSLFYEGFQMERNMNCAMLSVLCLLILIGYCSKKK
jgi:hypothetical protein